LAAAIINTVEAGDGTGDRCKRSVIASVRVEDQKLEEELRLERIRKYGKQSEKLSDYQLQLLDLEPAVSSEEVQGESERGPLPDQPRAKSRPTKRGRSRQNHPGRNDLLRASGTWSTRSFPALAAVQVGKCGVAIPRSLATTCQKYST